MIKKILLLTTVSLSILSSCKEEDKKTDLNYENPYNQPDTTLTYSNPVFEPVLADPCVFQAGNFFYAFGTEDDWGSDGGYHCVATLRSSNLVDWELVGDAFTTKPNWKAGGIWAPDVSLVNGQYFMYYSFSTWGDPNPGIGYAIATQPQGPYVDQGKLFLSSEVGVANSIDPFYIEENGTKYLFWGSFQGIYAIELAADGRSVTGEKTHIAGNHLEASYVYKKDGFYYYFGSQGSCCDGANSSYHVKVGRSENLLGPYTDKSGNKLTDGGFGELVVERNSGNAGYAGPGHNAEIVVDEEGTEWFLYHGIPKSNPKLDNGASRRPLLLDKIIWEDGWPLIQNRQPSLSTQQGPVF